MLLALADRRRAVADTLAALIADHRDPSHITHTVADVLRARMLAIGCGYPDGNDFDRLRFDPAHLMTLADEFAYAVSNPCDLAARFGIRQFRGWRSFSVSAASTVPLAMTTP